MIQLFQQRDFGNKLNATFSYVTQQFRSLSTALLYIVGPVALASGILSGILQSNILKISSSGSTDPANAFRVLAQFASPTFWLTIVAGILASLIVSLTTYAHMKVYDRTNGGPVTVAAVWAEVQPAIGRGLIISILGSIIAVVGMFFFFIPGVYVGVVLSLALAVTSFEGTDFGQTWDRCFKLIRDKWWSTFGLVIIMVLIVSILGLFFAIPSGVVSFLIAAKLLPDASNVWLVASNVISTIGNTLLYSLLYLAIGFQYTNLVERQEGRGLMTAIDSIGTSPARPRANDEGDY